MTQRFAFVLSCFVLLAACKDITHVQTGYVADRDECRGRAENNVSVYSQSDAYALNDKDRNTALLQLFCECMKEKDWKVAGCPKPPALRAATPAPAPTVVVVQSPAGQPAILPAPAPAPAYVAPAPGVKRKLKVCLPPTVCPAPPDDANITTPLQTNQQLNSVLQRQ